MGQTIKQKISQSLKIETTPAPIWRMLHISLSGAAPLIIGVYNNQFGYSVFGALFALAITLNDHLGPLNKRIYHLITCSLFLNFGLLLGALFISYQTYVPIFIFIASFVLGKIKNQGIELERMFLFSLFNFIAIFDSLQNLNQIYYPLYYSIMGFFSYLIVLLIFDIFKLEENQPIKSKRELFKNSFKNHSSNKFSIVYSIVVTVSFYFFKALNFKHSYWIAGTILIVMLPSFSQSFDKSFQRIFGTILGVLFASSIITVSHHNYLLLIGILVFSFFIPWALKLNYWMANVCIASVVLFITEAQYISTNIWAVSLERVIDISIGGFIAIFSNYFFLKK